MYAEGHNFSWAARIERGEEDGRVHVHCLLLFPARRDTVKFRMYLKNSWAAFLPEVGGIARTRTVGRDDGAVAYLSPGDEYEMGKYSYAEDWILSRDVTGE